jgi:mannan endo-1,4-beta-mannosidase
MIWYLYAEHSAQAKASLPGSAFYGSCGVDTEDILAIPSIDFGSL